MKKIIPIIVVIVLIVVVAIVLKSCGSGFGLGAGFGFDKGEGEGEGERTIVSEATMDEPVPEEEEEIEEKEVVEEKNDADGETNDVDIPDNIVVEINESTVLVNGVECNDRESLKNYLEEIHNDNKTYELRENKAILETYNMVIDVFDELQIELKVVK